MMLLMMSTWSTRRWVVAALAALGTAAFMALGTAMIENPVIVRKVATPWWAWLVLAITSVLSGLLVATYVREPGQAQQVDASARRGGIGGLLAYFAVGCPVCNKIALLLLGSSGALQWFAPIQPWLGVIGMVLLGWALRTRLAGERACPVPSADLMPVG
jgi:hypothetical protein